MEINLDLVQSAVLALVLLTLGEFARNRVGFLKRFAFPAPVIGGFLFALLVLLFRTTGTAQIEFDVTLQQPTMIAFFTTIGLGGSLASIRRGGRLLLIYLIVCWSLAIVQNLIGIGVATLMGIDPILGVMAGATSLEGGHGAAAAFGPTAEQMGTDGATAVAIAAATFGLVAGSLLGGPTAGVLMNRRKLAAPRLEDSSGDRARGRAERVDDALPTQTDADDSGLASSPPDTGTTYRGFLTASLTIGVIMVIGMLLGTWFSDATGFALPAYVGAMIIAVIVRNVGDALGWYRLDEKSIDLISQFTLGFFLTLAMMSLKLWELASLAGPLVIILLIQVVFIVCFAAFAVFPLLGRDYDAATMVAGFIGHGLGATPNALANMAAFNSRFGVRSEKAFLIVPLAGAVLIDIVALPWIVWCMNWVQ